MAQGQGSYGVSNVEYDMVTTLSNLLQGVEVMDKYSQDAQKAGNSNAAQLFTEMRDHNRDWAEKLRDALAQEMSKSKSR
jgi:hypothetical protein